MAGNFLISIFWLIRPQNIFIIAATMFGVGYHLSFGNPIVNINKLDFVLLRHHHPSQELRDCEKGSGHMHDQRHLELFK